MMNNSLKIIREKLQNNLNLFEWGYEGVAQTSGGHPMTRLAGLTNVRFVVDNLSKLGLFEEITESLKDSVIYTTGNDYMVIQANEGASINSRLTTLKVLASNFLDVLLKTVPNEDINSINIKLPPISDFDQLSKVAREIHIGLTQLIYSDEINGETKIVSVENGSIWFNVFVGASAVSVIASLVWASAVIYKKFQEGRMLAEQVRALKVKNESLEDVLKAQKAETDMMIEAEAQHIQHEHFKNNSPETIERIKNSISIFADLIGKGAEIQPALAAPESVSNLFPDPKNLIGLESKIKKLTA
ncbi:hypothetical protein MON38_07090 [Hymenobacter sp. DH14]|uniref:Uncharacterized protein n=2 Tax=Hymenobacter cyanobacteriorum TaxID=2926463 RepID=A0A9X1VIY1_9BACT|nr:hypothetical protein [Hymenobacter cyanobacteriorum]